MSSPEGERLHSIIVSYLVHVEELVIAPILSERERRHEISPAFDRQPHEALPPVQYQCNVSRPFLRHLSYSAHYYYTGHAFGGFPEKAD